MRAFFPNQKRLLFFVCVLITTFISCKKELPLATAEGTTVIFPTTQVDKQRVAVIKEVSEVMKAVYRKPKAVEEVNAIIGTGYYVDERVLLKDLIFPEKSPVYATDKFKASGASKGFFKNIFLEEVAKGEYPRLKDIFNPNFNRYRQSEASSGIDTTHEIWTDEFGASIYFPYSENFLNVSPTDPSNNTFGGNLVTIVSADREADSGPGWEPYYAEPDPNGFTCPDNICYRRVTVNDAYAEFKPIHIFGMGAHPARILRDPPPPSANVNRVYIGWVRLQKQYDKLISFNSQNGGGSELKLCRISGYLHFQNQQVTNFVGDQVAVDIKRRDINRENWRRAYIVWDEDWAVGNTEQILAVYEEDAEGTETFTGSLSTTVRIDSTTTSTGSIGYSITVKTQDDLILQSKYSRSGYFGAAKTSQGCGFQMCDGRTGYCRYDTEFLPSGQNWPIYNCGANLSFTWPYNSY